VIVTSRRSASAEGYDEGRRGELHHQIADRTADLALACMPAPRRILDVGCGTGYLLGRLAARAPQAEALAGIDAAPAMIVYPRREPPLCTFPLQQSDFLELHICEQCVLDVARTGPGSMEAVGS
jgi:ubiquinone/menaquinone biosynthesis C-methylase UbiE